jgi:hypothetical protein
MKLWFFAESGARMIACVDCSVDFATRLARLYNADPTSPATIDTIADNVDPTQAGLRIPVQQGTKDDPPS